jgi:rRNA maturation endonuclease Nob1
MKTTLEGLEAQRASLEPSLREFLLECSGLEERNMSGPTVAVIGPDHRWTTLDARGRALQAKLLREHSRFSALVQTLLRLSPERSRENAVDAAKTVHSIIDQSEATFTSTTEKALDEALKGLDEQLDEVKALYDPTPGEPVFVVDTSALIWNPDLEEWTFEDALRFSIVLTSTLLGELDELKMRDRDELVREKAEGAIRRIKEYGRRGDIHAGVTLRRDRSTVRMTAVEPDFENTLPWIDPTIKDDRLLAACLEIVREHPHSPVVLVTRDVNMQNKARHAGIQFVEPPDPPAAAVDEHPRRRRGPRPDVRILQVQPGGGGSDKIDFTAQIQNYGTQPVRATLTAAVDGEPVICRPDTLDLLVNAEPSLVWIDVPRPRLGELVSQFGDEPTLYGRELMLEVTVDGECVAQETWHEHVYDDATETERYGIQQRVWRRGRGEETEHDLRMERIEAHEEQQERLRKRGPVERTRKWYDESGDIRDRQF